MPIRDRQGRIEQNRPVAVRRLWLHSDRDAARSRVLSPNASFGHWADWDCFRTAVRRLAMLNCANLLTVDATTGMASYLARPSHITRQLRSRCLHANTG